MTKFNLKYLAIFILTTFILLSNIAKADYPNTSIGVIDLNKILSESKAALTASEQIEKIAKEISMGFKGSEYTIFFFLSKEPKAKLFIAPAAIS